MRSADRSPQVETFDSLDALPADAASLFAAAESFFTTRAWWEIVLAHAVPPNTEPRLVLIRRNGEARALFPMLYDRTSRGFRALTTPYTCLYQPLIGAGNLDIFSTFARYCRAFATTRVDALDPAVAMALADGGRQAGLAAAWFNHFGNWYDNVSGQDWETWLARRPGALRETIRRRTRRSEQLPGAHFTLFSARNDMTAAVNAFETVYARSWKEPEPYPAFNPAQIRAAVGLGVARVGVWWIGETPAAAQFWIVENGRATVLKLAHDEAFRSHSPGTVLTAWMIRHMIEREHVSELDFGRGDDPYKRDWVAGRRQRMGLLLINPRRPRGMIALAHHAAGRIASRIRGTG
jgi:CelD/BcsL family acetyltransferase involved in cellulose biosynthesis